MIQAVAVEEIVARNRPGGVFWSILAAGIAVAAAGAYIQVWAQPSPHGYIEMFFAWPLLSLGGLLVSIALLLKSRETGRVLRIVGWMLLFLSLLPLIIIASLLVG